MKLFTALRKDKGWFLKLGRPRMVWKATEPSRRALEMRFMTGLTKEEVVFMERDETDSSKRSMTSFMSIRR